MKIWVDADACPKVIRDILFRAAMRAQIMVTLVANRYLPVPPSPYIACVQVEDGFDVADRAIVACCASGDLVVTADIPLAAEVIAKGALALNPRGELYDANNIGPTLSARNFNHMMRSGMPEPGDGPPALTLKNRELFAKQLDKLLAKRQV